MSAASNNKAYSYKTSPHKTPKLKEPTPASCSYPPHPIVMDEFGQTPDHYYLAKKTPSYQVKRKLDLQNSNSGNQKANQRPRRKVCSAKSKTKTDKPRYDTSLGQLTKKFLNLLTEATDGVINLNTACHLLAVPKRRLYDITNVLEGAGLIQKTSRNNIQWMSARVPSSCSNPDKYELERQIDLLEAKENKIDEYIYNLKQEIASIKVNDEKLLYIAGEDLMNAEDHANRLILGVEKPPSVQIVKKTESSVVISSQTTAMNAHWLFKDTLMRIVDPDPETTKCDSYSIRIEKNNMVLPSDVYKTSLEAISIVKEAMYPETNEMHFDEDFDDAYVKSVFRDLDDEDPHVKSVFITEEDDIAPMGKHFLLQTEDQDLQYLPSFHIDNYSFSLDNGEGITDLYDCVYP